MPVKPCADAHTIANCGPNTHRRSDADSRPNRLTHAASGAGRYSYAHTDIDPCSNGYSSADADSYARFHSGAHSHAGSAHRADCHSFRP